MYPCSRLCRLTMTLPSLLSCFRILLTFLTIGFLFAPGLWAKAAALAGFLAASFTDWLDGYLARRWRQTSAFGAILDPIADKVLVLGMFFSLMLLGLVPSWMFWVIAAREVLVTAMRLAASRQRVVLAAAKEGKQKLVSQVVAIVVMLVVVVVQEWRNGHPLPAPVDAAMRWGLLGCLWIATVLTVISGLVFFWRHRMVLKTVVGW